MFNTIIAFFTKRTNKTYLQFNNEEYRKSYHKLWINNITNYTP